MFPFIMKVLISGGTGAIGSRLSKMLVERGHSVTILSRTAKKDQGGISYSVWDPAAGKIDAMLGRSHDAIVNLAGTPVTGRWTRKRKQEIRSSRIDSTTTLLSLLKHGQGSSEMAEGGGIKTFVSASAMGYYPNNTEIQEEHMPAGEHFLAGVCRDWENASAEAETLGARRVIIRISVVLDGDSGMLKTLKPLVQFGLLSALGNGRQYMGIIHIDDLCRQFLFALENPEVKGIYNGACLEAPKNGELMREISRAAGKPFFLPPVPGCLLKMVLGEAAQFLLFSFRLTGNSWKKHGFQFLYPGMKEALEAIYK
jgi:uncharacterized protein (TIGR01777 family)